MCVGTSDDDHGDHKTGDDKTTSKDKDDQECSEVGHGHECKGDDSHGVGDARDKMAKEM